MKTIKWPLLEIVTSMYRPEMEDNRKTAGRDLYHKLHRLSAERRESNIDRTPGQSRCGNRIGAAKSWGRHGGALTDPITCDNDTRGLTPSLLWSFATPRVA